MNKRKNTPFLKARAVVLAGSMALTGIMSSPVVSVVHAEEVSTNTDTDKSTDKTDGNQTKTNTNQDKPISTTDAKADEIKDLAVETKTDTPNTDTTKSTDKVDADYTINMDDTRNVQLTSIVASVASKVEDTASNTSKEASSKKALKNAVSSVSANSVIGQTLSGVKEAKDKVENKKNDKSTPQGIVTLDTTNSYSYLYGDYLVQIKNLDVNKSGAQDAKIEMSKLSATDKQLLTLSASKNVSADKALKNVKKSGKVSQNITVQMDDVSGPQINFSDASTTIKEGDTFDIKNYVSSVVDAEDGDVGYTTEGSVDTGKTGDYTVNVIARDSAGNVTTKPLNIHVETKEQADTQNQAQTNTNQNQTSTQQTNTNGNVAVNADGSTASIIAQAALNQIGRNQDCTMLVTNSLAAAGINFHGWPYQYSCLGSWTNNPVPGDIIIYSGHVAVYIGNGMAVHGGFYGYQTVKYTVACSNALIGYIHVGG